MWNWLISARLDFDLKDSDDGPMVRRLNVRAACVLDHFYVLDVPALEQYSVLWKEIWHCCQNKLSQPRVWTRSGRIVLTYCVWRSSLFRGAVIDIAANVEFIGGQEVYRCLLEALKDWTLTEKSQYGNHCNKRNIFKFSSIVDQGLSAYHPS